MHKLDCAERHGYIKGVVECVHEVAEGRPLPRWSSRTLTLSKGQILMTTQRVCILVFIFQESESPSEMCPLSEIPEDTSICNIESAAGDRGTMVRASGNYPIVVSHDQDKGGRNSPALWLQEDLD